MARRLLVLALLVFAATLIVAGPTAPAQAEEAVFVVPIEGTIEKGLAAFVTRVMSQAANEAAAAVIFDIDTPGGALGAALTMRDAILYSEVKTIAFVNPRAISAGSLISLATDHIVMEEGGTIGAATAVDLQGNKASEKIISYFRNEMKATAEKTGRNPELAEAMVDEDVDIPGLAPKGKLLTLTTEEAIDQQIAELKVTATGRREKLDQVLRHFGLADARVYEQRIRWSEQLVRVLTYPYVASLLMTLGFLGLIFEIQSPGWGVGGTVGLICLGLFFGAHLLVNLADWTEVLIFLAGVTLVIVDLFFIAGFGALGIPGLILMVAGLWLALVGRPELWTWDSVGAATRPLLFAFALTVILGYVMWKRLPKSATWNRVVLQAETSRAAGYTAAAAYDGLVGTEGVALTSLRPAGTGLFGDRRVSVATEGDFLEKDTTIKVVAVEGNRVTVRRSDQA